jgi:hypothetical protein
LSQEAIERAEVALRSEETERKKAEIARRKKLMESQIEMIRVQYETEEAELLKSITRDVDREKSRTLEIKKMAKNRIAE